MHFVSSMVLDIVNTIYICFSMDRDQRVVTRQAIHNIYQQVCIVMWFSVKGSGFWDWDFWDRCAAWFEVFGFLGFGD